MSNPFVRNAGVDKPGIVGARWWNQALRESSSVSTRRSALTGCLVVGVGLAALGGVTIFAVSKMTSDEETTEEKRRAIELQRDYGWNFGAVSETVAFDTRYTQTYAREALARLASELAPSNAEHAPYYLRTLFESPEAVPRLALPDGETARVRPLAEALRPILTPSMTEHEKRGRAYGELITQSDAPVLTVVDLPGPEAVAFAAGAAPYLDPVFLFDNWPHPRGVVPAHQTLAAAVYYHPVFAKARASRPPGAPAIAVVDRARLNAYTDDATQFDNRYLVKLPPALAAKGKRLLYVVPASSDLPEKDDLNAIFVDWVKAGIDVRALAANAFEISGEHAYFGGTPTGHASFFAHYTWKTPVPAKVAVSRNMIAAAYRPVARPTTKAAVDPAVIGLAPIVLVAATGVILGSRLNRRSGSYNRTYRNYGGG